MYHDGDEWWWCRSAALIDIAQSLRDTHIAIIDEFLPATELAAVVSINSNQIIC
jgi:hypothetical protein